MNSDSLWSAFGKIALVVGVAVGLLRIIQHFGASQSRLVGRARFARVRFPARIAEALRAVDDLKRNEFELLNAGLPERVREAITGLLGFTEDVRRLRYSSVFYFVRIRIQNKGKAEAVDVRVSTPWSGVCSITLDERKTSDGTFEREMTVGSIRPGGVGRVVVWTTDIVSESSLSRVRITHPAGVVYPRVQHLTPHLPVWLSRRPLAELFIFVSLTTAAITGLLLVIKLLKQ